VKIGLDIVHLANNGGAMLHLPVTAHKSRAPRKRRVKEQSLSGTAAGSIRRPDPSSTELQRRGIISQSAAYGGAMGRFKGIGLSPSSSGPLALSVNNKLVLGGRIVTMDSKRTCPQ
jgi:hypothetical protein